MAGPRPADEGQARRLKREHETLLWRRLLICHREPPLGGVAIQGGSGGAVALDCFVAALLAMTWEFLTDTATRCG